MFSRPPGRAIRRVLIVCSIGWVAFTVYLVSVDDVPDSSFTGTDWLVHALIFMSLTATSWAWLTHRGPRALAAATAAILIGAVGSEVYQAVALDGRSGTVSDIVADVVGAAAGAAVVVVVFAALGRSEAAYRILALGSALALVMTVSAAVLVTPAVADWWRCRGADSPREASTAEPLLRFDLNGEGSRPSPVVTDDFRAFTCSVPKSDSFTVVVSFQSDTTLQGGPSRIVASSVGTDPRQTNFHIGQSGANLSIRLRVGDDKYDFDVISNITGGAVRPDRRQTVALRYARGTADVWVDGELLESFRYDQTGLDGWNSGYPLLVGDEFTRDRPFQGSVFAVAFYDWPVPDRELADPALIAR